MFNGVLFHKGDFDTFRGSDKERVCKTETIIQTIWNDRDLDSLNRIDVLVNKLREKLKGLPYIIENHKKVGYSLKSTNLIP